MSMQLSQIGEPARESWRHWLGSLLLIPKTAASGPHIDPIEQRAPEPRLWPRDVQVAWLSREMELFRDCLRLGDMSERDSVLDDLSKYYALPREECRQRCLDWEDWSLEEWRARDRTSGAELMDFYDQAHSWNFDLLWYAYLQSCGFETPASVLAALVAQRYSAGPDHLDFGSGVGATSQLFARLGFSTTLADISKPMLEFASWRLQRHGDNAKFLDLKTTTLPPKAYDIITAIDTLVLVPDFDATIKSIHRALKPGGWLLTDFRFDVREKNCEKVAFHLYDDDIDLQHRLRRIGFVHKDSLGRRISCYQRTEPTGALYTASVACDPIYRRLRKAVALARRVRMLRAIWLFMRRLRSPATLARREAG